MITFAFTMKRCVAISRLVLASLMALSLLSCSGEGSATEAGGSQGVAVSDGASVREPAVYTNGKARALLDKFSAHALTPDDCREALEMVQGAMDDVQRSMSEIVESATSQVEATEELGDRQREFQDKYRYVNQLRDMLRTLPDSCMDAAIHQEFQAWDRQITDVFRSLENKAKEKFAASTTGA